MKSQYTILIVEDESIVALDLQSRLQRLGYLAPAFVATGPDAIAKTVEIQPDLILMDIKLRGEMDGIEAARQIREQFDIPVIYLTAFADETTLQRAKITGPYGYLLKPFEERELLATIRMALYRYQAEAQVKASEAKFRSVIEQSNDGIVLLDEDGIILEWNAAQEDLTGWKRSVVLGLSFAEVQSKLVVSSVSPESGADKVVESLVDQLRRGDDSVVGVQMAETTIQRPDGAQRTVQSRHFVIQRESGYLIASINRDVTEQRQVEETIRQAQKMESLGVLAGGTAHDFNNLLVVILGQSSLALAKMGPTDPARAHVEKAVQAAEKASELTQKMLNFSGRGRFELQSVNLNDIIYENQSLYLALVPKRVRIELNLDEALPLIAADPGQIQQVVLNILLNAVEAIGGKPGVISISTRPYERMAGESTTWRYEDGTAVSGNYALLEIRDTGVGMDADTLAKIFDPFFTTKKLGRGLGMAAVLGIVRGHGGCVQMNSEPNAGSTFKALFPTTDKPLPAAKEDVAETAVASVADSSPRHVLVIDDEEGVCEAVTDILDIKEIPTLTALDGQAGLDIYRQRMNDIGLVLLDLSMPGMDGAETFRGLRQIDPQAPVILSSGYDEKDVFHQFDEQGALGFLQKPYNLVTLLETVGRHINSD